MKASRCGVELSRNRFMTKEAFVSHANAALTPRARLRLARLIVDHGWPPARAAERYDVSWKTAVKWADRYRQEGPAGMVDRSSRPHHQPNRTPAPVVRKIVHPRWKQRLGPVPIATKLNMPTSTVHAVLALLTGVTSMPRPNASARSRTPTSCTAPRPLSQPTPRS